MIRPTTLVALTLAATLAACSSQQLYSAGRNAQRAECMKRADPQERDRCLQDAGMSYETYRRESGDRSR